MLSELRIRNYALIDELDVRFGPGLNVITGETGAGKSIILGALSLVIGERPDPTVIRTGTDSATVEARFDGSPTLAAECLKLDIDADGDELVLRRRAERGGRTTAYANDSGVTVARLRGLGDRLVDLHGQHQHQLLLQTGVHREIVDSYARLGPALARYRKRFDELHDKRTRLAALQEELDRRRRRRELTEFQYRELADADIQPGEVESLDRERELLESAERRYALAHEVESLLSGQEGSVAELLAAASKRLDELAAIDESLAAHRDTVTGAEAACDDAWRELVRYRESIEFSPERLEEVNARLHLIERLGRKHGLAAAELPALTERLRLEMDSIEVDEDHCRGLAGAIEKDGAALLAEAERLSLRRSDAKRRLETKVVAEFRALGLPGASLVVAVSRPEQPSVDDLDRHGCDTVEFLFSANPGEPPLPLRKVASGGEISRVMLALKNVLAGIELVATMVFDEIDAGIGGSVAEAVGRRLARLGRSQQVICITHLPQIAKFADRHFLVTKSTRRGRSFTAIHELEPARRAEELARMVAGARVTETGLAHAREMLEGVEDGR